MQLNSDANTKKSSDIGGNRGAQAGGQQRQHVVIRVWFFPLNTATTAIPQSLYFGQFGVQELVFISYSTHYVNRQDVTCAQLLKRARKSKQTSTLEDKYTGLLLSLLLGVNK